MNCKVFFRILIIGTVILMSVSAYAAEDHLTISPSTEAEGYGSFYARARAGKLEVTISGERDSREVTVDSIHYSLYHSPSCSEGEPSNCGSHSLSITVLIKEGENSGKSTYERKLPVYLEPGNYNVNLYISDSHNDYNPLFADGCFLFVSEDPIPISIENITGAAITEGDTFTLEGITVPGYAETYWGTFKWNPNALSFDLMNAGVGTGVSR